MHNRTRNHVMLLDVPLLQWGTTALCGMHVVEEHNADRIAAELMVLNLYVRSWQLKTYQLTKKRRCWNDFYIKKNSISQIAFKLQPCKVLPLNSINCFSVFLKTFFSKLWRQMIRSLSKFSKFSAQRPTNFLIWSKTEFSGPKTTQFWVKFNIFLTPSSCQFLRF